MASAPFARVVPLETAFNLRDFGGYATADGRTVRRAMLYRSGTMALLTDRDAASLRSLGIRTICDFRRQEERAAEPTRWHAPEETHLWSRDYRYGSGLLGEVLKRTDSTAADMRASMIEMYRAIPYEHAPAYVRMFEGLAGGEVPMLVNCSAGKDRTGVAAALVLHALGVPRATIEQDYLETNAVADWPRLFGSTGTLVARTARDRPDVIAPLLRADRDYLATMFATLDERHGGVDAYLRDELRVDAAMLTAIRDRLLEP